MFIYNHKYMHKMYYVKVLGNPWQLWSVFTEPLLRGHFWHEWPPKTGLTVYCFTMLYVSLKLNRGLRLTFNNISVTLWRSVLPEEETGVSGENHWPVASHWQTLSHNVVSNTPRYERGIELKILVVIGTDCTGSCKSNYHAITTTTALKKMNKQKPKMLLSYS